MLNIKELFNKELKDFKFHIKYTNSGCRIWIGSNKTKYYAGGYGYDKESSVLAKMINDLIGKKNYGNAYTGRFNIGKRFLSSGIGFEAIKQALNNIGIKLEKVYNGYDFDLYYIDFKCMKDE